MPQILGVVAFLLVAVSAVSASDESERVLRLTQGGARNGQAFWSPDRASISWVSNARDGWQVWLMAADGSAQRQLTHETAPVGWPSWSRDGKAILFYGQRDGAYRLLRVPIESGAVERIEDTDLRAFRPLLDPSGRYLLFDAADPAEHDDHEIYVRDLQDGSLRRLTQDPGYDSDARWSPDGRRIVFHSDRGRAVFQTQIFVMRADGSGARVVSDLPGVASYPSWSPNGRCIVFAHEIEGNRDLWLVDATGEGPVRLTQHPGFDSEPVFSPEGRILFSTDRFEGVELALLELRPEVVAPCLDPG